MRASSTPRPAPTSARPAGAAPGALPGRARLGRRLLLVLAAAALGGCLAKPSPQPRYYLLEPLAADSAPLPAAAGRERPLAVELVAPRLPQYLERPQIVTRVDANRLAFAELDRWGGNLAKNLARVVADNLALLLATPDVRLGVRRAAPTPDVRVELAVTRFERDASGRVRLVARWRLLSGDGARLLTTRVSRLDSAPVAPEAPMAQTVARMSELLGELSRRIAATLLAQAGPT